MFRLVHVIVAVTVGAIAVVSPGAKSHPVAAQHSLPPGAVRVVEFSRGERFDIAAEANAQQQAADAAAAVQKQQEEEAAKKAAADAAAAQQARAAVLAASQAAPPAAAPASYSPGSVQQIIHDAFAPYGQAAIDWGERVAKCESGYNPRAYNPAGPYYGLFQFLMSTFKNTPYGNQDIYDPVANANAAAWKYGQGGASAWGCR